MPQQYWLFKTEPDCYSIDDLAQKGTDHWDGVRNYQARNFLRDTMKIGDQIFIYHSRAEPMAIVGLAEISREGYPDHTQFDPTSLHPDPTAKPDNPRWFMVDVTFVRKFTKPLTLNMLRGISDLADMRLLQKGQRLSIQPVTTEEAEILLSLAQ